MLERAGIPYKYWSYGSDLDDLCFWPEVPQRWSAKTAAYYGYCAASVVVARRTFRRASSVMISPYQQEALTRVCPGQNLFFLPHVVRPVELEQVMRRKEQARQRLCLELDATHLFFSSTRHHWLRRRPPGGYRPLSSDEKGNDLVLRAFAGFRRAARGGNPKLVLVCKGPDVDASRRLAAKLGVDDAVVWRGEMKRAELETYYAAADVCFGQFGAPVLTYSCIEPLAWATPTVSLIATGSSNPVPFYADLPPVCSTRDPDVMADFLHKMTEDRAAGLEAGRQSWEWVVGNCSEQTFLEAFNREI